LKIFAVDTSAKTVSAAILSDDQLISQVTLHTRLTHSETLLPICADLLKNARIDLSEIDLFAASIGPGSFTGLRIGISAIKGFAFAKNKPCAGISSLLALACNHLDRKELICAVTDARRDDAYCAFFESRDGRICRLSEDMAVHISEMGVLFAPYRDREILLIGDGAKAVADGYPEASNLHPLCLPQGLQQAYGVGLAAYYDALEGRILSAKELMPTYIRLPQAQRERLERLAKQQQNNN
jgi:tRNA threonylcarbamoyladenosine biosynthesis protein TsaB